ncbi:hypothetical protein MKX01_020914 [Papaver californicum]|nr:hypothetical protein MKX01_020914 [Papaver californicum]
MEAEQNLPFEVGQLAESKSFKEGFRGAWFRCKIKDYRMRGAEPTVALEYYDFPDEKITRMNLYRLNPAEKSTGVKKRHLMLRPCYPQIYLRSQMPDVSDISEVVGIVDRPWKVGDMVDWLKDGCYWSACITNVQDGEIVQVQFPRPPMGEGGSYVVPGKELRPSLDWTPELGWTVPIPKVGETSEPCVRLIHPKSPGKIRNNNVGTGETLSFKCSSSSVSSHGSASSFPPGLSLDSPDRESLNKPSGGLSNKQKTGTANMKNSSADKTTLSSCISSTHGDTRESVSARKIRPAGDRYNSCGSSKRMRKSEADSTLSDMIESSIMDLEELVNRVKWLKGALEYGVEFSTTTKPTWKFLETRASLGD